MATVDFDDYMTMTVDDRVARLTLERPANRNALTVELLESLLLGMDRCVDAGAGAIVLAASGPAFCAGLDLTETDPDRQRRASRLLATAMRAILTAPVPVIARVHGPVRAGGIGLVAAADVAIAAHEVSFAFTEVRLGLAPAVISACVLPRLRPRDASRLFLTAEPVTAAAAADLGLIDEAVHPDELDERIAARVAPLLAAHPQGMRATKALLTAALVRDIDEHVDELVTTSSELFATPAAREAIAAARRR